MCHNVYQKNHLSHHHVVRILRRGNSPVLYLAAREDSVEDHTDEMHQGGDDEHLSIGWVYLLLGGVSGVKVKPSAT